MVKRDQGPGVPGRVLGLSMLNCLVIGMAGTGADLRHLAHGAVPPGQDVSLVNVASGIGLPFSVLFLLRVTVQILRERGWLLDEISRPA